MNYAVLGMGRTGHAVAAYLLEKGREVAVWNRSPEALERIGADGIRTTGKVEGTFSPRVCLSVADAVRDADYILIMTVANGHAPIARALRGNLRDGQRIIVFNGNWGAFECYAALRKEADAKGVVIAETSGMLFLADFPGSDGVCHIKSIKEEIGLACIPKQSIYTLTGELRGDFPQFAAADNVAHTSINNSNPVIHTPITLYNITRMERGEDYCFYGDAATHLTLGYVEKIDAERCEVARAIGVEPQTCLAIINSFWPVKHDNLYDAMKKNTTYTTFKGPKTVDNRYITEDIPFGVAAVARLGREYGVRTPYLDAMLQSFACLLGEHVLAGVPDFGAVDLRTVI